MTKEQEKDLLADVLQLAAKHGTRSKEVCDIILSHDNDEFQKLAAMCMIMLEGQTDWKYKK